MANCVRSIRPLQHFGGEREGDRQVAGVQIGKIRIRQHLQREARAAGLRAMVCPLSVSSAISAPSGSFRTMS